MQINSIISCLESFNGSWFSTLIVRWAGLALPLKTGRVRKRMKNRSYSFLQWLGEIKVQSEISSGHRKGRGRPILGLNKEKKLLRNFIPGVYSSIPNSLVLLLTLPQWEASQVGWDTTSVLVFQSEKAAHLTSIGPLSIEVTDDCLVERSDRVTQFWPMTQKMKVSRKALFSWHRYHPCFFLLLPPA